MNTQTISRQDLINLLMQQERGTFVNVIMETIVGMNKKNNPYYELVTKRSKCNYLLGCSYEERVTENLCIRYNNFFSIREELVALGSESS